MSEIQGIARLGSNPELKYVGEDKKPVCEISVRFINGKQDKITQEWEDRGFWAQVNIWGKCAEPAAKMFSTGDRIIITGNMVGVSWADKDDPEKTVSGLKVDTNSVAPYLPDLMSLEYKERSPQNQKTSATQSSAEDS